MSISGQGLAGVNQTLRFLLSVSGTLEYLELLNLAITYGTSLGYCSTSMII